MYSPYNFKLAVKSMQSCSQCASVVCHSETCTILKHVSDWHSVLFWNMCISGTILGWHRANLVTSREDNNIFFYIAYEIALLLLMKNKYSLALLLVSFQNFLCIKTLHLCCFDLTKFAQCQFKTWLRNAHFFSMAHHGNLKHVLEWYATRAHTHCGIGF